MELNIKANKIGKVISGDNITINENNDIEKIASRFENNLDGLKEQLKTLYSLKNEYQSNLIYENNPSAVLKLKKELNIVQNRIKIVEKELKIELEKK